MQALLDRGVNTRRGIMNSHQEAPYAGPGRQPLPHSEAARDGVLLLPLFPGLSADDQRRVTDLLATAAFASAA